MKPKMFQEKVKIVLREKIGKDFLKLVLASKKISNTALPGQFIEVKVSRTGEPLLRRPLGVHSVKAGTFTVLCEIVGKGTIALSKRKQGELLDIIGPLGNGFNCQFPVANSRLPILVAGGMGVAPLLFLAERLRGKALVLIGAKTKGHVLCEQEFKKLGCEVKIATDDGSKGFKGRVTDLLQNFLSTIDYRLPNIYACGPRPMLRALSSISQKYKIPTQVSLEEHMACGIGACLGCVIETKSGYKRVCKEGPVFCADEIIWQ